MGVSAWIFQGNPRKYDVDDYLARYPELVYWRTPRYAEDITNGDRAFLWRSGSDAGVVAIGTIVEAPVPGSSVKHPEALGNDLWQAEVPDLAESRTGIRLHEVRHGDKEGFLSRRVLKAHPALSRSLIIRMPTGTVFPLDPAEAATLESLWAGSMSNLGTSEIESALEGRRVMMAHYRRERSAFLRDGKIASVRDAQGYCACEICGLSEDDAYPCQFADCIFEVHHRHPLRRAADPVRTTLDDLAVLCASCHRAVHATHEVEANFAELLRHFR
jgi:hypothetical protein